MSKGQINHKELLTFSNLTNLEWEFVNLEAIKEGESKDIIGGGLTADDVSTQLKDLLTPEVFARRNAEGKIERYIYMNVEDKDNVSAEEKQQGIIEMRKEAGIAMEYLEKWQQSTKPGKPKGTDEGSFIGDWEVVYGRVSKQFNYL